MNESKYTANSVDVDPVTTAQADDSGLLPRVLKAMKEADVGCNTWEHDVDCRCLQDELEKLIAHSQPVPAESSEYVKGLRDAAKAMCMFCADPNRYTPAQWEQGTFGHRAKGGSKGFGRCFASGIYHHALIPDTASPVPAGQDEVSKALAELQKMLPNESFTVEATFFNEVGPRVRIGLKDTNRHFVAPTLEEAMKKVREWKGQQG